jgi:glycosyltransferase involved in cell wall biosynthesis
MKIAVVSAHYMPEVGYQEVHLPRAFARIGHTVKVFTSDASVNLGGSVNKLTYIPGISVDEKLKFEILRLPAVSYKSKAYSFSLRKAIEEFAPDVLVILGVAKIFPRSLLTGRLSKKIKIVSIYGDSKEYLERGSFSQKIKTFFHELGYATIKKSLYKSAVKYSDKIILNIPETDMVFQDFLNAKEKPVYETKKVMLNLGFDPDEYYFNETDRADMRKKMHFEEDDIVIITSTRINKRKNLENIIKLISQLNSEGKSVKYIMVGFLGDAYETELKKFIQTQSDPKAFVCFPFLDSKEIRKLYCAADAGIWLKAAISIQEAMGTGLPVILENKPSVNHLLKEGVNGWFFEKNTFDDTVKKAVVVLQKTKANRKNLAEENAIKLSYDNIARKIIETIA